MKRKPSEFAKVMVISTAHVPESLAVAEGATPSFMSCIASMTSDYGWLVRVNRDIPKGPTAEPPSIRQVLRDLLHHAERRGAHYVMFDADADCIPNFPTYDW